MAAGLLTGEVDGAVAGTEVAAFDEYVVALNGGHESALEAQVGDGHEVHLAHAPGPDVHSPGDDRPFGGIAVARDHHALVLRAPRHADVERLFESIAAAEQEPVGRAGPQLRGSRLERALGAVAARNVVGREPVPRVVADAAAHVNQTRVLRWRQLRPVELFDALALVVRVATCSLKRGHERKRQPRSQPWVTKFEHLDPPCQNRY
jgi:hypothetical protein